MKSLFNKINFQISYRFCTKNFKRFVFQINSSLIDNKIQTNCLPEMSDQNDSQVIDNKHKSEDNSSEEQSTKRLKTEDNDTSETVDKSRVKREKLRKWVLLLSYCGRGYYGMQRQTKYSCPKDDEFPTIEYRLFDAFLKSGVVTEEKFKEQHLSRFQRAARTDRGVSAIKQIVSIQLPDNFTEQLVKVNEFLPQEIRLIDCIKVTKAFDAKNFCDARTYSYLMPSYSLCPIDQNTCPAFRVSADTITQFNDLLKLYVGTHNYHNFTSAKAPTDASAMRYIMEMDCSHPFLMDDNEFVVVRVKGQAFMLHQIRKMIGLALAIIRGIADKQTIMKAFEPLRIDIPKAPGLGLLLEEVHYDRYNQKYGGDGIHQPIKWEHKSQEINEFKRKYIYPVIVETENEEKPMFEWLQTLIFHTYDERKQTANQTLDQIRDEKEKESPFFEAHLKVLKENEEKLVNSIESEVNVIQS